MSPSFRPAPARLLVGALPVVMWLLVALLQHGRNGVEGGLLLLLSALPAPLGLALWTRRGRQVDRWLGLLVALTAGGIGLGIGLYPLPEALAFLLTCAQAPILWLAVVARPRGRLLLGRPVVAAGLLSVWVLAFVLAPYWGLPVIQPDTVPTGDARALTLLTLGLGVLWSHRAAGAQRLDLRGAPLGGLLLVGALLFALDWPALGQSVLVNDDEPMMHFPATIEARYHLRRTVTSHPLLWLAWQLLLACAALRRRIWPAGLLVCCLCMQGVIEAVQRYDDHYMWVLRHPYLGRWLSALPLALAGSVVGDHRLPEWTYRLVPSLTGIGVSLIAVWELRARPAWLRVGAGLAVGTVPLVLAYRSMLYLEMLALPPLAWACLRADALTRAAPARFVSSAGFLGLVLATFVRETTVGILGGLLGARLLRRAWLAWRERRPWRAWLPGEAWSAALLLLPLFLFVWFRGRSTGMRSSYEPSLLQLFDLSAYWTLLRALVEQMLPLLLLGPVGMWLAWRRGDRWPAGAWALAICAHVAFHRLDPMQAWFGYGRFNLFLVAPLLAGWLYLLARLRAAQAAAVLAGTLALNLIQCPLYLDGSRVTSWGRAGYRLPVDDTYPYREAFLWLRAHAPGESVRFSGPGQYAFWYYFPLLEWEPPRWDQEWHLFDARPREVVLDDALRRAAADGMGVVVFQRNPGDAPAPARAHGFELTERVRNRAHELVIYRRSSPG